MWVARDKNNVLLLHEKKPKRMTHTWESSGNIRVLDTFPFNELPGFIEQLQWKDAPIQVKFEIKKK